MEGQTWSSGEKSPARPVQNLRNPSVEGGLSANAAGQSLKPSAFLIDEKVSSVGLGQGVKYAAYEWGKTLVKNGDSQAIYRIALINTARRTTHGFIQRTLERVGDDGRGRESKRCLELSGDGIKLRGSKKKVKVVQATW